jgi:hypothetical protein
MNIYHWRSALVIGAIFAAVGVAYYFLQGNGVYVDRVGATLLIILGAAMAFGFTVLFKGSRGL